MPLRPHALDLPLHLARTGESMHRRLYNALRAAMLEGRLPAGARLPSTRALAAQLGVARGTVVAVFEQLTSEGYVTGRVGSGTAVAPRLPDSWFKPGRSPLKRAPAAVTAPTLSRWAISLNASPFGIDVPHTPRPFRAHWPAVDVFPAGLWGRAVARRARRDERLLLSDGDARGYRPLREAVAVYLRSARGVRCSADQVVIVPSTQQLVDLVARLVINPGDRIWMEDPGYRGARTVFEAAGAAVVPVPVDDDGMKVATAIERAPNARLAFVTPGHQAPLGVTLSLERRFALLDWAAKHGAWIIEDDYDSEYRYEGRPLPALQGIDRTDLVIHTGTFSKTLLPSLRLAYAVVPDRLLDPFLAAKSVIDRYTPPLLQAALSDFMEAGHFGRHLRRMREVYAERRAALLDALAIELAEAVTVVGANAGLDLCVRFSSGVDDQRIVKGLAETSIDAIALSRHTIEAKSSGLLLGFAAFSPARLRRAVALARPTIVAAASR